MIARALFELSVEARLLEVVPNGWALVTHHADVEKLRLANKIIAFKNANPGLTTNTMIYQQYIDHENSRITAIQKSLWPGVKRVTHWSGINLSERCAFLKTPFDQMYGEDYPRISWYAHPGLTGIANVQFVTFIHVCGYAFNLAAKSYEQSLRSAIRAFKLTNGNDRILDRLEVALEFPFADTDEQMEALRNRAGLWFMKRATAIDYSAWQPLTHWHWPFPVPSRLYHGIRVASRPSLPSRDDAFFRWAFSNPEIENLERCHTWLNLDFRDVEVLSSSRQQRAVELVNNTRLAVLIAAPVGCEDSPILLRYKDHFTVFRRPMMKTTPWGRICGFENTSLGEIRDLVRGVHRVFHARLTRMINPLYFFSLGLESTNPYISTFLWLSGLDSLLMAATRKQFCDRLVNVFGEKVFILRVAIQAASRIIKLVRWSRICTHFAARLPMVN